METILIVDDIRAMAEQYAYDLERLGGYRTRTALGGKDALETLEKSVVDCMILDLEMPGTDGFDVLDTMREREIRVPVIVYTGTGNYDRCVRAVKAGAYSFIDKAEPMERVAGEVENALKHGRLLGEIDRLRKQVEEDSPLLGGSRPMAALREAIARVAPIQSAVLVLGESGTGKELVARELHRLSKRPDGPFLALNSGALPQDLVESELFGHEAGAFTGANRARKGAFETASGGTLFLDEIGELPLPAQAKLLRVLETSEINRVGSSETVAVDTRIVTATHRDPEAEIDGGRFRRDLYYRLNVHVIEVPPLRARTEDIPLLVTYFLGSCSRSLGVPERGIDDEAVARLQRSSWRRNNVRELRNIIERMLITCESETISIDDIPEDLEDSAPGTGRTGTLRERKADAERAIVLGALQENGWHITETAAALGLADHSSLLKIMRRHQIKKP